MLTVKEVSRLTGQSVRTLHYYDSIGLLKPKAVTNSGYRLYDDECLKRLGQIMLFRELSFSLKEIKDILDSPGFDRTEAIEQQIRLLTLKKERLEQLIGYAEEIKNTGEIKMDFKAFDSTKITEYEKKAKAKWGGTEAYKEYEEKSAGYTSSQQNVYASELMNIFTEFGSLKDHSVDDKQVQKQVQKLRDFITSHYYNCTVIILSGLGQMYCAGGEMTDNIDAAGGKGTAEFVSEAIAEYCKINN